MRALCGLLCVLIAILCGACNRSAPGDANQSGAANTSSSSSGTNSSGSNDASTTGGQNTDTSKLDAEVARLEQQARQSPDDDAVLAALSDAYVRRGHALHAAHRLMDALHDYQSALKFSPDHEEANLRVAEITQEIGAEPHAEDGKPVSVPAKPETNK